MFRLPSTEASINFWFTFLTNLYRIILGKSCWGFSATKTTSVIKCNGEIYLGLIAWDVGYVMKSVVIICQTYLFHHCGIPSFTVNEIPSIDVESLVSFQVSKTFLSFSFQVPISQWNSFTWAVECWQIKMTRLKTSTGPFIKIYFTRVLKQARM